MRWAHHSGASLPQNTVSLLAHIVVVVVYTRLHLFVVVVIVKSTWLHLFVVVVYTRLHLLYRVGVEDDVEFSEEVGPGFPTAVMYIHIRSSSSAAKPREGAYNARSRNGNSKILGLCFTFVGGQPQSKTVNSRLMLAIAFCTVAMLVFYMHVSLSTSMVGAVLPKYGHYGGIHAMTFVTTAVSP